MWKYQTSVLGQNVGGGDDILAQVDLPIIPADSLIHVRAFGILQANMNEKRVKLWIGSGPQPLVFDGFTMGLPDLVLSWVMDAHVLVDAAPPYVTWGTFFAQAGLYTHAWGHSGFSTDFSFSQKLKLLGKGVVTGDVQMLGLSVEVI